MADAKERLDQAVEEGMLTEAQAKEKLGAIESNLDDIVNGKFPDRGERHFRWRGGRPTTAPGGFRRAHKASPLSPSVERGPPPAGLFRSGQNLRIVFRVPITISGSLAGRSQRRIVSSRPSGRLTQPIVGFPRLTWRKIPEPRPGTTGFVL